jgi:hypothetical protein
MIALMDVDPEHLEFAQKAVRQIVDQGKYPTKVYK